MGDSLQRLRPNVWGTDPTAWTANSPTPGAIQSSDDSASVVARHIFYNHSRPDGFDPAADVSDDRAIAPDKSALLPGEKASFENYTSYTRGINGIMIDIAGADDPSQLALAENFAFHVGNDELPDAWPEAPTPKNVTVRPGVGIDGADRVTIIWADAAIVNTWLQVRVRATLATGLSEDNVFYFGNAIGETGNSAEDAIVNKLDEIRARTFRRGLANLATIEDPHDFNRDRLVNVADQIIARNHRSSLADRLRLIAPPALPGLLAEADTLAKAVFEDVPPQFDWLAEIEIPAHDAIELTPRHRAIDKLLASFWG